MRVIPKRSVGTIKTEMLSLMKLRITQINVITNFHELHFNPVPKGFVSKTSQLSYHFHLALNVFILPEEFTALTSFQIGRLLHCRGILEGNYGDKKSSGFFRSLIADCGVFFSGICEHAVLGASGYRRGHEQRQ